MKKNFDLSLLVLSLLFEAGMCGNGPCALLEPRADATCIPLASINRAFSDARQYLGLTEPALFPSEKIRHHLHEIDQLGMVLGQTTKYIAKEFDLTQEQVEKQLSNLDLELTDIWAFCPENFRPIKCKLGKYREISGKCNNLNFPEWGSAFTSFQYLSPAERPDGVDYPKDPEYTSLPLPRVVSSTIHSDHAQHDHSITTILIAWAQITDHDITLTAETKDPYTHKNPDCCKYLYSKEGHDPHVKLHHNCFPIQIPYDDPFYSTYNLQCMNFLRSVAGVRSGCKLGPRTAMNSITSYLDASFVYGSEDILSSELRTGKYGMLKSLFAFRDLGLKDILPLKLDKPDEGCIRPNENAFCFLAGDHRVNEQLILTVLHTVFMREHNRIALNLAKINPHWSDEQTFQETRRIIIAFVQHITYDEFLPMVLGKNVMHLFGLTVENSGHWNGYDPNVNPSASEEFIVAAFRFGHSLLPQRIERWSLAHNFIESVELHRQIRQPFELNEPGRIDTYILGMANQLAQAMDEGITEQVTTLLFRKPTKYFGKDLAAMNIQRGRDHAIAGYGVIRKLCGLSPVHYWEDLQGIMRNETIYKYKLIYRSPEDIDLWSAGVSEIPQHGSLLGPTFGCIIGKQFRALRSGDRHWYELPSLPSSFTEDQLQEIKKIKLSRILCDNSDNIKNIQVYPMLYPDPHRNPRVPCQGTVLPRIDLTKWREIDHDHHRPKFGEPNDNYVSLHPPKFDPKYLKPQENPVDSYLPFSPIAYNISYETTNYPKETPTYPTQENSVEQIPINFYDGPPAPPEFQAHYNGGTGDSYFHSNEPYSEGKDGPEIMENLEAPPYEEFDNGHGQYIFEENGPIPRPPPPVRISHSHIQKLPNRQMRQSRRSPFPRSPFPGLGGIFSPNPGYLVKQRFSLPRFHG